MISALDSTSDPNLQDAPSRPERLQFIQGLRAVAVLIVILFHAGVPYLGGFIGVDVFFVISGFVITAMLQREFINSGSISFRKFYLRRYKRLAPALAAMITFTLIVSVLLLSPFGAQQQVANTAIGAVFFFANFAIALGTGNYFSDASHLNPLLNTWSLSVEEQIYLIFPAVIFIALKVVRKRNILRFPIFVVASLGFLSFALATYGSASHYRGNGAVLLGFYSPISRFWEFAVGALIALSLHKFGNRNDKLSSALSLFGVLLLGAGLLLITDATPFPGLWTLLPVLGTAFLIIGGLKGSNPINRILSTKPMVKVGDWSYSLYLWHWPFIVFAAILWPRATGALFVGAIVGVIPAFISYRYLEDRIRHQDFTSRSAKLKLIGATSAIPVLVACAILFASNNGYWSSNVTSTRDQIAAEHSGVLSDCLSSALANSPAGTFNCLLTQGENGIPIYLVGDSYAQQFSEAATNAGQLSHASVIQYTMGGCPIAEVQVTSSQMSQNDWREGCSDQQDFVMRSLKDSPPGVVLLANAEFYLRDTEFGIRTKTQNATFGSTEKLLRYQIGLTRTIDSFKESGHKIVLVQPIPNFRLDSDSESISNWAGADTCSLMSLLKGKCANGSDTSLSQITFREGSVWRLNGKVAEATNSQLLDFRTFLCPEGNCDLSRDGVWIYKDYLHLTVGVSKELGSAFASAISKSLRK